jgi:hypothetical protein
MYSRPHQGRSIGERLGWDRQPAEPKEEVGTRQVEAPQLPVHCWVVDCPSAPGRWPGVLLKWSRSSKGWHGRVVFAVPQADGEAVLTMWVDVEYLRPVDSPD